MAFAPIALFLSPRLPGRERAEFRLDAILVGIAGACVLALGLFLMALEVDLPALVKVGLVLLAVIGIAVVLHKQKSR